MAVKVKKSGIVFIAVLLFAGLFSAKVFWWDKRPQEVQESKLIGNVVLPDAPEASLAGKNAIKLELPSNVIKTDGTTQINWYIMAWQSQNGIVYANGGKQTTKGSLFDRNGLAVTLTRQDNCQQSCTQLINFCKQYKDNPNIPATFVTFMGSGIPAYITNISNAVKDLGPEYQPIAFLSTGKSYGEDQIIGDIKYKTDKQNLKGAVLVGVRMDGDNDLAFKLCGDNSIKVNADETLYDPEALNLSYPQDFLDAVVKYNSKTTETRKIVKDGKTTGRDTSVYPDLVATWTPGDVNAIEGRGGVTIISTKEYASIMPNITITCKKWLNDHREIAENILKSCAIAGDQIRSFEDVKKFTCGLNADVYDEKDGAYWLKYFNGVKVDENTHLGGSRVFNLADMANMFGIYVEGQTDHNDIYGAVYNLFGTIQSKNYPKDLPTYLEYNKAFDKTVLQTVINNNPELLEGKVNVIDYKNTEMKNKIGSKSYNIVFKTGSAELSDESEATLLQIYQDVVAADGTKVSIVGHTDNTGNPESNLDLSKARAASVLDFLNTGTHKLERERLSSSGKGDTEPIADNTTQAGKAKNRRVTITLLSQ